MYDLFDMLNEINKEDKGITSKKEHKEETIQNVDESFNTISTPKEAYDEEAIKKSGLDRKDYIRLNSYVGSRINTDFRTSTNSKYRKEVKKEVIQDSSYDSSKSISTQDKELLLIIDGSSLLSTSYFARLPKSIMFAKTQEEKEAHYGDILQTKDGVFTNGVFGFMQTLLSILDKQKPTHIAVCLDRSRNCYRRDIYPEYKAHRKETDRALREQYALLEDLLNSIGIKVFISEKDCPQSRTYEADDFAGSLSKQLQNQIPVALYTKDMDYLQLIDYNSVVWMNSSSSSKIEDLAKLANINLKDYNLPNNTFLYTEDTLIKVEALKPKQIIDYKSISGDSSDGIPGIKGLGDTTSKPLLSKYESLEDIYNEIEGLDSKELKKVAEAWKNELGIRNPIKKLLEQKDNAFMSKELATIKTDIELNVELEDLRVKIDKNVLNKELEKLEMYSLLRK